MKQVIKNSMERLGLVAVSAGHGGVRLWHAVMDKLSRRRLVYDQLTDVGDTTAWLRE